MHKNLRHLLFVLLTAISFLTLSADENPPLGPGGIKGSDIPPIGKPGGRSAVAVNRVVGYFAEGILSIWFENPEGTVSVEVCSVDGVSVHNGIHQSLAPIYIPASATDAPFFVSISTSEGNEYEGWIE